MGELRDDGGRRQPLRSRTLVGRGPACDLRLDDARVSGEHATVWWAGDAWCVRDLGSRNGTWVDGERVEPGGARTLEPGSTVSFAGEAVRWSLVDADPPVAWGRASDGRLVRGSSTMLALPDPDAPTATVFRATGAWLLEADDEPRPVSSDDVVEVDGVRWTLALPDDVQETIPAASPASLEALTLRLIVSRDEEHVELEVVGPEGAQHLGARSHLETLLYLARRRLADVEAGQPAAVVGWVHVDEACTDLRITENRLNVHVYRARQQLADAGVEDAHRVVERRPRTLQLRCGAPLLEVLRP